MSIIFNEKYIRVASSLIESARKEIFLMCFLFSYPFAKKNSPLLDLYEALFDAQNDGVDCRVIVNYTLPENKISRDNRTVAEWLQSNGIPCRRLPRNMVCHAKLLIVDGATLIAGSHNWTVQASSKNFECSLKAKYEPVVKTARKRFLEAWDVSSTVVPKITPTKTPPAPRRRKKEE